MLSVFPTTPDHKVHILLGIVQFGKRKLVPGYLVGMATDRLRCARSYNREVCEYAKRGFTTNEKIVTRYFLLLGAFAAT